MIRKIIILLAFILFLSSCGKDWEQDYNTMSGENRKNSYEFLGTFFNTVVKRSEFESNDSVTIIQNPLALKLNHAVAATNDGKIYLSNYEEIKWKFELEEDSSIVAAGMCADNEMNIYAVTDEGYLYSIDFQGEMNWKVKVDDKDRFELYADLLYNNEQIIFATTNGDLKAYNKDADLLWEKTFNLAINKAVAAGGKNLYFNLSHNNYNQSDKLVKTDLSGNVIFEKEFNNFRLMDNPIYHKGKIYTYGISGTGENKFSYVYVLDSLGNEIHKIDFPVTLRSISVDDNESIYLTAYNSGAGAPQTGVYKLNKDGKIDWRLYFKAQTVTPVLISEKLVAFLGITAEGPGMFFLDEMNGRVKKVLSLSNTISISTQYCVIQGPEIMFPIAFEFGYIRITNLAIDRILPF